MARTDPERGEARGRAPFRRLTAYPRPLLGPPRHRGCLHRRGVGRLVGHSIFPLQQIVDRSSPRAWPRARRRGSPSCAPYPHDGAIFATGVLAFPSYTRIMAHVTRARSNTCATSPEWHGDAAAALLRHTLKWRDHVDLHERHGGIRRSSSATGDPDHPVGSSPRCRRRHNTSYSVAHRPGRLGRRGHGGVTRRPRGPSARYILSSSRRPWPPRRASER